MGRPPIGKRAMTSTERVHRYRQRHARAPETKPETKLDGHTEALERRIGELQAELQAAKARIRELETKPETKRGETKSETKSDEHAGARERQIKELQDALERRSKETEIYKESYDRAQLILGAHLGVMTTK